MKSDYEIHRRRVIVPLVPLKEAVTLSQLLWSYCAKAFEQRKQIKPSDFEELRKKIEVLKTPEP